MPPLGKHSPAKRTLGRAAPGYGRASPFRVSPSCEAWELGSASGRPLQLPRDALRDFGSRSRLELAQFGDALVDQGKVFFYGVVREACEIVQQLDRARPGD